MAADSTLLRRAQAGEAWVRLYRWSPACLSFGRNEPALSRYDRILIESLDLDVVRRPTGGRAVWHDAEVTYAVAAPVHAFPSLAETYLLVHGLIARALRGLGVETRLASRPAGGHAGVGAGACFASPAGGEVTVAGRKLVGSAQVREGNAFLQHGSILMADGQDLVSRVTRGIAAPQGATSLRGSLGTSVTFHDVADAIGAGFQDEWEGGWKTTEILPDPSELSRFGDTSWTWRR